MEIGKINKKSNNTRNKIEQVGTYYVLNTQKKLTHSAATSDFIREISSFHWLYT